MGVRFSAFPFLTIGQRYLTPRGLPNTVNILRLRQYPKRMPTKPSKPNTNVLYDGLEKSMQPAPQRKHRRTYPLKTDLPIYEHLAKYSLLTCAHLAKMTDRAFDTIQHRMEPLYRSCFVN